MKKINIHHGMNTRPALKAALMLGCRVTPVRGTPDLRLEHRLLERTVRFDATRKDCPRAVTEFLFEILRTVELLQAA